ncbi:MAG: dihydroorotate dehydrogenase-like protein [Deltaproteobacteria bacterium]|nr:dihydroorotate dehydrogenase-like protein [Deltaproteobacteria bacterium]
MTDLSTRYVGLDLKNPIIVGSSGLTRTLEGVKRCAEAGAAAVVLKSIFEEQITAEVKQLVKDSEASLWHPEASEYISSYGKENAVSGYLELIRQAKQEVEIPIIASVHCVTAGAWTEFVSRVEQAGADAIELNAFVMPSDPRRTGRDNEQFYFDVVDAVKGKVKIPLSIKLGFFFSSLMQTLVELSETKLDGLVLFNRFYSPDFDVEKLELVPARIVSSPGEYVRTLRWISLLSGRTECDIAASTGIHDGKTAVKQLLAGADAVQVVSALYQNGLDQVGAMLDEMQVWMESHEFASIADFKGKLSQESSGNPAEYVRVQFMKHSVGIE